MEMQVLGIKPNSITMLKVFPMFVYLLDLEQGKWIRGYVIRSGLESNVVVGDVMKGCVMECNHCYLFREWKPP